MAITTENFSAAISGWTTVRGSVALARVAADNSGSIASETNGNARRDFDTGSADMFTEVDVVAAGADANRTIFLMARCTSAGGANSTTAQNYYAGALNANAGTLSVLRYTNGAATALVSGLSVSVPATPFKYRIEVEGSTVRVFIGGTQVWSGTDTSITSGTRGGVGFYNAGTTPVARIDNFRTGALADDRTVVHDAAVPLSGGGALGANATATRPAAVAMSGGGSLGTAAAQQHRAAVAMSGGGQLAASAGVARPAAAPCPVAASSPPRRPRPGRRRSALGWRRARRHRRAGGVRGALRRRAAHDGSAAGPPQRSGALRRRGLDHRGGPGTPCRGSPRRRRGPRGRGHPRAAGRSPAHGRWLLAVSGTRVKVASAALAGGGELGTGAPVRAAVTGTLLTGGGRLTARANSTAGGALNPSLWARDPATDRWVQLPHVIDLAVTDVENDVGAVSCEYPAFGWRSDLLRTYVTDNRDLEVEVWLEGSRASRMVGWLKQRQGDDVSEEALWSFSGVLVTARLDEGVIEPQPLVGETTLGPDVEVARSSVTTAQWDRLYALGYRTSEGSADKVRVPQKVIDAVKANRTDIPRLADPKREARFVAATPGAIMLFLLGQCWARGALTDLTVDFTATHDSSGVAWPEVLTAKWSPHVTLLQVAQRLAELTLAEFTVSPDRVVRMWRFGGRGTNRSAGERPVTLRRGHNLLEAGRRQGSRDAGTDFYVAGGEGQFTKATDANARARFGRVIERAVSVGNIEDPGALTAAAQRARDAGVRGEDERTFSLALGVGMPRPGRTLGVGDTARVDTSGTLGTARLAQWHVAYGVGGVTAEITTGDLIQSRAAGLLKRLAEQQSGDTIVGTSQPSEDRGVPAAPTGLVVQSRAYTELADAYAAVTAGCAPVEVNTDGTAATDVESYEWQWATQADPDRWVTGATTAGPSAAGRRRSRSRSGSACARGTAPGTGPSGRRSSRTSPTTPSPRHRSRPGSPAPRGWATASAGPGTGRPPTAQTWPRRSPGSPTSSSGWAPRPTSPTPAT
ncbi:hypothetical protein [Pseudonocardia alni]|uniref:hypothetical protein n=1 Tax=Pseudonocardia alni TaxID=33907 RepID=UPI0027A17A69|nr:hypothetical protein PaSha_28860 [Pseudonocardia alni]